MNWFKIYKYNSYNLRLPTEIESQIDIVVNNIINFYKTLKSIPASPVQIGTISFFNIYSKSDISVNIFMNNQFVEDDGDTPAKRDRNTGNIYLNIFKQSISVPQDFNDESLKYTLRNTLKNQLYHELSHSIDPKIISLNKQYSGMDEKLRPTEFDGYSQEITRYILEAYKIPQNKEKIREWVTSSFFGEDNNEIMGLLKIPDYIFNIIKKWRYDNPDFLKRFRQRIYNEIMTKG